jgi:hypothetical protein
MRPDRYEIALTCSLTATIKRKKLDSLRLDVLQYLVWVATDPYGDDPKLVKSEIQRCANRLKQLAALVPEGTQPGSAHQHDERLHA